MRKRQRKQNEPTSVYGTYSSIALSWLWELDIDAASVAGTKRTDRAARWTSGLKGTTEVGGDQPDFSVWTPSGHELVECEAIQTSENKHGEQQGTTNFGSPLH
jgi:hypothetical protein